MKIVVEQRVWMERALKEATYQDAFPLTTPCAFCAKAAIPIMVIDDEEGLICSQKPYVGCIWPHDSLAIALYLCPDCGRMTALWNQA